MVNKIDASMFQKMFLAGAKNLEAKKEWINELNVFLLPDGDTGTNMTLTIMSAAKEVGGIENPDMKVIAKAISSGSLKKQEKVIQVLSFPSYSKDSQRKLRHVKKLMQWFLAKACNEAVKRHTKQL